MAVPHVAGVAALWYESLVATHGAAEMDSRLLADRLIGSGCLDRIERSRIRDAGTGIVQAPLQ
jgi:hypothetical protein